MTKILFLYAHPNSAASHANRVIVEEVRRLPNLTFHPLYEIYPEFWIDVAREQQTLLEHQVLVFQHPVYWYGLPPLLKLWMDEVLEYNFAHGQNGSALRGKRFLLSVTVGGTKESFREGGAHGYPFESFLFPYRQMAQHCGMVWEEPAVLYHALQADEASLREHGRQVAEALRLASALTGLEGAAPNA